MLLTMQSILTTRAEVTRIHGRFSLMIRTLLVLFIGSCLTSQSARAQSRPSARPNGKVTIQGCVSRQSGDFILTQSDPGNSYVLQAADNMKLGQYLGQLVKMTGTKSPTLSDSSDAGQSTSAVTLTVSSVKTISKECTR